MASKPLKKKKKRGKLLRSYTKCLKAMPQSSLDCAGRAIIYCGEQKGEMRREIDVYCMAMDDDEIAFFLESELA